MGRLTLIFLLVVLSTCNGYEFRTAKNYFSRLYRIALASPQESPENAWEEDQTESLPKPLKDLLISSTDLTEDSWVDSSEKNYQESFEDFKGDSLTTITENSWTYSTSSRDPNRLSSEHSNSKSPIETTESSWITSTSSNQQETTENSGVHSTESSPQEKTESSREYSRIVPQSTEDYWITDDNSDHTTEQSWKNYDEQETTEYFNSATDPSFQDNTEESSRYLSDVNAKYDFECKGDGRFPNPQDCASFIECSLSIPTITPCPTPMHYSPDREDCTAPCNAHCNASLACACGWPECHQGTGIDCESDPDIGPCKGNILRYFYDRESGKCKRFFYGGCQGNGNNFRTRKDCERECQVSLLGGFRCPSSTGNFGHYPDCMSYYKCKRGLPILKRCPKGTAFHHMKSKCVPENEAACVYECREPNAVYPVPNDRHRYIDCVNGIAKLEKCPKGLIFDPQRINCILERTASFAWK